MNPDTLTVAAFEAMNVMQNIEQLLAVFLFVSAAIHGAITWLLRRASKTEVKTVDHRVDKIESQVKELVEDLERFGELLPTREDLHLLRLELMDSKKELEKSTAVLEANQKSFERRVQEAQAYTDKQIQHTERLVSRTERAADMLTEHLLNRGQ